jgi:septal ring factor EnvC (AmiA/AmiB activator)
MAEIKIPNIDLEKAATDFNNAVKEAAYVAVGLGVLGFQRAQVQRVELAKQLEAQLAGLNTLSTNLGTQVETLLSTVREQLAEARTQVNKVSADLPDAEAVRSQLTDLAKSVDDAMAPARHQFEEQLDRLEEVLPEAARNLVHTIRSAAVTQEQALRTAVGLS